MKILFVSPSYKPAYVYGGPAVSVSQLAESLASIGHQVTVYTTTANGREELPVPAGVPQQVDGVEVWYFKRQTGDHTHVSPALWRKLWLTARRFDVIHLQSWWSLLIFGAAWICRARGCRYIISPRGMLSTYTFSTQHSGVKKMLHRLIGHRLLRSGFLHATSQLEWDDCRQIHSNWKGFVLPNLIDLPAGEFSVRQPGLPGQPLLFAFLGRIDPKKGLELLFESLADLPSEFRLRIGGEGEERYLDSLKMLAKNLHLEDKIEWCGWQKGVQKYLFLQGADLFVLTSYNENFANAVIESLAVGTPVLLSDRVGLHDYVEENDFGWVTNLTKESIVQALLSVFDNRRRLAETGQRAISKVAEDFNKVLLAEKYASAYQQLSTQTLSRLSQSVPQS